MIFNNDEMKELREILNKELIGIHNYDLADKVDLLKDDEVKDILLKVFINSYKKENGIC